LLGISPEEHGLGKGAGWDDDRRYCKSPDWSQGAAGNEPDGEAEGQSARGGQHADGNQGTGKSIRDRGQDRRQGRVGPLRRSPYGLAVKPTAEREPLGAVETRWIGAKQDPPANGKERNSADGKHRAYPVDGAADRGLGEDFGPGTRAVFAVAAGRVFCARAHSGASILSMDGRTAVATLPR
jgi:hypothetical protein